MGSFLSQPTWVCHVLLWSVTTGIISPSGGGGGGVLVVFFFTCPFPFSPPPPAPQYPNLPDLFLSRFLLNFSLPLEVSILSNQTIKKSYSTTWLLYCYSTLKCQCREILWQFFVSWIEPPWASDKQNKLVLLKDYFSQRYSNFKFEKFDSA